MDGLSVGLVVTQRRIACRLHATHVVRRVLSEFASIKSSGNATRSRLVNTISTRSCSANGSTACVAFRCPWCYLLALVADMVDARVRTWVYRETRYNTRHVVVRCTHLVVAGALPILRGHALQRRYRTRHLIERLLLCAPTSVFPRA